MGHAIDKHRDTAVQVFWTDRQISLKISVAVIVYIVIINRYAYFYR